MKRVIAAVFILLAVGSAYADNPVSVKVTPNGAQAALPELWLINRTTQAIPSIAGNTFITLNWGTVFKATNWNLGAAYNADGVTISTIPFPAPGEVEGILGGCNFNDVGASTSGARAAFTKVDGSAISVRAMQITPPVNAADPSQSTKFSSPLSLPVSSTSTLIIQIANGSGSTLGVTCTDLRLRYVEVAPQPIRGW